MSILVAGASGATGRLLVRQLLERGQSVKAIVRSADALPEALKNQGRLAVIRASVLDLGDAEMAQHVRGCTAVASCLGHNLSLRGIFGHPRRLVTEATRRLCAAIEANKPATQTRFVLMNTAGNSNRDLREPVSFAQRCVIALLRLLLPPHPDNEQAADYLRTEIGQQHEAIGWCVVRPDTLLDEERVSAYTVHPSPTRSAIFDPGKTSRVNVAHFMAELLTDETTWKRWKGQMPVIYNETPS
jgi:nucleoside-diphosphate-sugar epimerase